MSVYIDSSFLVSLYTIDIHSPAAKNRLALRPIVRLTPFHCAELAHALFFQVFRSRISTSDAQRTWTNFKQDCAGGIWKLVELPQSVWESSIDLARRHGPALGIRTLDSLHVACALELGAQKFWTFDERQAKLAKAVGLDTKP